jgi:hypothetical protein
MQRLNTYKMTAWLKVTIEIEAQDDDEAWDEAQAAQLADWNQGELEIIDCENLGAVQNDSE